MKILQIIKKVIIGILAVAFFAFAISMAALLLNYNKYGVTQFDDTTLILVKGEISSDNYKKGDLVVVQKTSLEKVKENDELFAYKVSKDGSVSIDLSTVTKIHPVEKALTFENGATYAMDLIIGRSSKVYNNWGTFLSIIESKWGFLAIILVPSFLIFIYEIYALIIEIKYGKEDEIQAN